jgi:hypothetical protein
MVSKMPTMPTFQAVQPRQMTIYVLGSNGNLWMETGPFGNQIPPPRIQVDGNATGFQALDGNNVVVLGSDRNLWFETWPFGNQIPPHRVQVDAGVRLFNTVLSPFGNTIFVLRTDNSLWSENWPPSGERQRIASNVVVADFQPIDVNDVAVLEQGTGNLSWYGLPWGAGQNPKGQIDVNIRAFQPIDAYNVYVLDNDLLHTLFLDTWPASSAPPWQNLQGKNRSIVDSGVTAFQAVDVNTVFVLGSDGNLWLETSPWGDVSQMINRRHQVASKVAAFNVWMDEHNTLGDWVVLVKDTDNNLSYFQSSPPSTTWTGHQVDGNVM